MNAEIVACYCLDDKHSEYGVLDDYLEIDNKIAIYSKEAFNNKKLASKLYLSNYEIRKEKNYSLNACEKAIKMAKDAHLSLYL